MKAIGWPGIMPQVVEAEIGDARLPASRSEAVLNIRDGFAIAENVTYLLGHLREDSMEGVIDREHAHGVILGNGQDDEAIVQADVIPL